MPSKRFPIPQALLTRGYGGVSVGASIRKTNFQLMSRRFLIDLVEGIGLVDKVEIEIEPGPKNASGVARLVCGGVAMSLSEPPTRDGLRIDVVQVETATGEASGSPLLSEPVAEISSETSFNDFIWRVKKLLAAPAAEGSTNPAPALNAQDLFSQ